MKPLVFKLLRDIRWPLVVVCLLLLAFEALWVKITQRTTGELFPLFQGMAAAQKISPVDLESVLFKGPGKIVQTLMGGENIKIDRAMHMLSIGYVHPLIQTLFCIWAIGRSTSAIAGELDRGTMELLLAQPIRRPQLVLAHLGVDLITIPILALSLWGGTWLGTWLVGPIEVTAPPLQLPIAVPDDPEALQLYPAAFAPALLNVAAMIFAVSGCTMTMSALGRFRWQVMGAAVLFTLLQFLVNVFGQLWEVAAPLRALTLFYYYQPQQIVLADRWQVPIGPFWTDGPAVAQVPVLAVLFGVGIIGYSAAWWIFSRRDLPAPL
jgi:ABC-2 type transport system permease protein